jgi:hypothetical protein
MNTEIRDDRRVGLGPISIGRRSMIAAPIQPTCQLRRQHRLDIEPTNRDVVAHAVVGRSQCGLGSGRLMPDIVDGHRPPMTNIDHSLGAADCDDSGVEKPNDEATTCLDGGSRFVVAHESIRQPVRRPVGGATATDAQVGAAGSTEVLVRAADPLVAYLDHRVSIMCAQTAHGRQP